MTRDPFIMETLFGLKEEPNEEQLKTLTEGALAFLAAGGVLSLADWRTLSDPSREAFQRASAQLRRHTAAVAAQEMRALFAAAAVTAPEVAK